MRVRMGLPAGFFKYERNANFHKWDQMYPAVSRDDVESRLRMQSLEPKLRELLMDELMTGTGALHPYPSGIPPPAAIRPIRPPMHAGAKLVFTIQHLISQAAREVQAKFSEEWMRYGVDEPSSAHCQMPMFTLPKPNTTARQVLFDDSTNNYWIL
ncbi:hypothetical protein H4R20_000280 [Coemansia guatemalensis]|uniref:Uncharacterized protein n=1 Tax=Coemansia guatemalensis TaxID=2761395 RepID=A0A9W8HZI7_9FUNG|nr:hypothetical protein H4R20_000280 [Coemansia guatemalensis]